MQFSGNFDENSDNLNPIGSRGGNRLGADIQIPISKIQTLYLP
jgi:hypothetical protein